MSQVTCCGHAPYPWPSSAPNGAGKTTFVRAVAALTRPDEGELRVGGYDVGRDPRQCAGSFGPPGSTRRWSRRLTGRENLDMLARLFDQGRPDHARVDAGVRRVQPVSRDLGASGRRWPLPPLRRLAFRGLAIAASAHGRLRTLDLRVHSVVFDGLGLRLTW